MMNRRLRVSHHNVHPTECSVRRLVAPDGIGKHHDGTRKRSEFSMAFSCRTLPKSQGRRGVLIRLYRMLQFTGRYGYQVWHFQGGASPILDAVDVLRSWTTVCLLLEFLPHRSGFEKAIVTQRKPANGRQFQDQTDSTPR